MKKIFTLFIILFISLGLNAQVRKYNTTAAPPFKTVTKNSLISPSSVACDTVNLYDAATSWSANYYTNGAYGYIFGTNDFSDYGVRITEDANYFDISSSENTYISGGLVYFGTANSTNSANLKDSVLFKVYADNNGIPGTLIGSVGVPLSQINEDVQGDYLTEFRFDQPLQLPSSKKFYVSIDHSNFHWDTDSISIMASGDDETTAAAYQKLVFSDSDTEWTAANDLWVDEDDNPLDVNLFIFPYVSSSATGCGVLPVSLFNFGGSIISNEAHLNWSTAAEKDNKGFYVERSKNGRDFDNIGFVQGVGNSNKIVNYAYTDASLKDINVTTTYYRLKQVDVDGKFTYSKVLPLSLQPKALWKIYPNPVKNTATVELDLENASNVTAQLIARDGKVLLNTNKGVLSKGVQQFYINTQSIAQGSYILRVTIGNKTYSQLLIKQ